MTEQRNREEIIKIESDIRHIKETTEEIKKGVSSLVARSEENRREIIDLRGRIRAVENNITRLDGEMSELRDEGKGTRAAIWKISVAIAVLSAGGAVGVKSLLNLAF